MRTREIKDDEPALLFCNLADADRMSDEDESYLDFMVISKVIPEGEAVIVSKQEFLTWLYGRKEDE